MTPFPVAISGKLYPGSCFRMPPPACFSSEGGICQEVNAQRNSEKTGVSLLDVRGRGGVQ